MSINTSRSDSRRITEKKRPPRQCCVLKYQLRIFAVKRKEKLVRKVPLTGLKSKSEPMFNIGQGRKPFQYYSRSFSNRLGSSGSGKSPLDELYNKAQSAACSWRARFVV